MNEQKDPRVNHWRSLECHDPATGLRKLRALELELMGIQMDDEASRHVPIVYCDTCIVSAAVKGDHPAEGSALSSLLSAHSAAAIQLSASTLVRAEIERLPATYQGEQLDLYNQLRALRASLVTWLDPATGHPSIVTDPLYASIAQVLSDTTDRRHVFNAMKAGVDYFATLDERTILSHRSALEELGSTRFGLPSQVINWIAGGNPSSST